MERLPKGQVNDFIRERLCALRRERKLSVREAASLTGIPESSYSCLERGYYRITLQNLHRILQALGGRIDEVWPSGHPMGAAPVASSSVPDADTLNYFRFREFVGLSDASQAVLFLREKETTELVHSFNLSESEEKHLLELVLAGSSKGWKTYRKSSHKVEIYLALKDAFVGDHLNGFCLCTWTCGWPHGSPSQPTRRRD